MSQPKTSTPNKNSKSKALYPYTLQPIALNMTETEFKQAQLALFDKSVQNFGLKSVKPKEWIILGAVAVLAVVGLVFVSGYSTILFWLMLIGVVLYLLLRTLGLKWYTKREYDKQVSDTSIPDELNELRLGVQAHGLIMAIPTKTTQTASHMRGMQMRAAPMQQGVIPWSAVTSWDETRDFIFIMFDLQGQKGSQIIPKRLKSQHFPIDTVTKHLQEVKAQGLDTGTALI
ncbi:MAG: YcxB family protein [Moraxella sp.]|nr:YcxB family protein [Moraxella sp.]